MLLPATSPRRVPARDRVTASAAAPPTEASSVGLRRETAILLAVWSVPAAFMVFQMYATAVINQTPLPPLRALFPAMVEWLIWVPLTPAIMRLARRFPVRWPPSLAALGVHAAGVTGAAILRGTVYACATFAIGRVSANVPFGGYLWRISLAWLPIAALVWGGIIAATIALDSARALREREVRDSELRAQLARAELGALRARLHPHFLFNALHSVGALVRTRENDAAVRVVADLSQLLRDVIARDAPEMVRLREELAFVKRYVDIESVRFADRLRVDWQVSDDVRDAVVPSFIMQPLVENAIHHAVSGSSNVGHLQISATLQDKELAIDIVDDGPGPMSRRTSNGNGVGLADTRERLTRLYAERGSLKVSRGPNGGTVASLRIPFRPTYIG